MDKWGMLEKILIIGLFWVFIVCILYGIATDVTWYEGDTTAVFLIYLGQTAQLVYYFTMPIILFLIACSLLKDE